MKAPEWYVNPVSDLLKAWRHKLEDLTVEHHLLLDDYWAGRADELLQCIDALAQLQADLALRKEGGV